MNASPQAAFNNEPLRADYRLFLAEHGLSEDFVRRIVEDTSDHIDLPPEFDGICVAPSSIQGVGTFATKLFERGDLIAPARIGTKRTVAGRRTNHSPEPNCRFDYGTGIDLLMFATCQIKPGCEFTIDYRQAMKINREIRFK